MQYYRTHNSWWNFWPGLSCVTYSLNIYSPYNQRGSEIPNEFCRRIMDSKVSDVSQYFEKDFLEMIKKVVGKTHIDLITTIPNSDNKVSPTMGALLNIVAKKLHTPSKTILVWIEPGIKRHLGGGGYPERARKTKNHMKLTTGLQPSEKNILVLDDTRISGMTALEATRALMENGATNIYHFTLGTFDAYKRWEIVEI